MNGSVSACRYDAGQYVARLSVRAGDDQAALVPPGKLVADLLQVVDFPHDAVDDLSNDESRLGQAFDPLAVTLEDFHPQLVFKLDNGL